MTPGCSKLCPPDCPSKYAKRTFLGWEVLSALLHCLPESIPMETNQDVPNQQQSHNFTPTLRCANQNPQYSYSLMISWLLPIKVWAERSHFVFLSWRAEGSPDSPLAKLYVSVFSLHACRIRSFSPAVLDAAGVYCSVVVVSPLSTYIHAIFYFLDVFLLNPSI